jgi:5'-3' exonuclease
MKKDLNTVIVTNDKDLSQLVHDPDVIVLRVDKAGEFFLDEKGVKEKYGVRPDQIVDWIGLMGDAVDGIPGAPGIGEKGAAQLLEQFGSIENALAGWEEVKKKTYRESLRDNAEQIRMSRELATIDVNVPVELDLNALSEKGTDRCGNLSATDDVKLSTDRFNRRPAQAGQFAIQSRSFRFRTVRNQIRKFDRNRIFYFSRVGGLLRSGELRRSRSCNQIAQRSLRQWPDRKIHARSQTRLSLARQVRRRVGERDRRHDDSGLFA